MAEVALKLEKLNELYSKGEQCDKELFSEMKSNVLLVSGKHFEKTSKRLWNRLRDVKGDEAIKVRLQKNHLYVVVRTYVNEILNQAPGVRPTPHDESELSDQKAAEISDAVWQHAIHSYNLRDKIKDWCEDFVDLGEVAAKIFWDPNKGKFQGYEQEQDELGNLVYQTQSGEETIEPHQTDPYTGQIAVQHQPKASDRAVFSGDFVFETILPFNLLRDPQCESMDESPYLIVRKMMDIECAKALCGGDKDKEAYIKESSQTTFKVFDAAKGDFTEGKNQILVKEIFYRPCYKYPDGLYCLYTEDGIIIDPMPLPFGIFPIVWRGFQKIQTTPRAHSIIRNLRPLQAEINRMSSMQAQNSIAFGDDKLVIQGGSKVEKGAELPGMRVVKVSGGAAPTVIPGRTGSDWLESIQAAVEEMYRIANLEAIREDNNTQLDPNSMLFRSMRHKKKFSLYADAFEAFLIDLCKLYLKLAKQYLSDDILIKQIGKREFVNIPEFKSVEDSQYQIKLMAISDDANTMLGKSLQIQNLIQYLGKNLDKETIAQVVTAMPFLNGEQMLSELTMNQRNADSDILSMDRGQYVPAMKGEDHKYLQKRLRNRMKQKDFQLLDPQIQSMYQKKLQEHIDMDAQETQEIQMMKADFIPTGGALVGVDVYTEVPNSSGGKKTVRARVPYEAVQWLLQKLDVQGTTQSSIDSMDQSSQSDLAQRLNQMNQGTGAQSSSQQPAQRNVQGASNGSVNSNSRISGSQQQQQQSPGSSGIAAN